MADALQEYVYDQALIAGQATIRRRCPKCSSNRTKNKSERTLSITNMGDRATFLCHHCNASGAVSLRDNVVALPQPRPVQKPKREYKLEDNLSSAGADFLIGRGISAETASRLGMVTVHVWFRELGRIGEGIAFPYVDPEGHKAFKFRSIECKEFSCDGVPRTLFNCPPDGSDTVVITEGELDAAAATEAGVLACSVPSGALNEPVPDMPTDNREGGKLGFLWTHRKLMEVVSRVVIATDADRQGQLLAEEIARRVGRAKCFLVSFPEGCKDLNDVLVKLGPDAVKRACETAQPFKIAGLHNALEYQSHVDDLYQNGLRGGEKTGWSSIDDIMTIKPGMLYVVTGIPGSGKSSWIDALNVNIAKRVGWHVGYASFENPPALHISKLVSTFNNKPFAAIYKGRMTEEEKNWGFDWVNRHFLFMSTDDEPPTVTSILDRFRAAILRMGVRVCVMDPANFLMHADGEEVNDQVDKALVAFKNFAMTNDVAFILVAHPKKPANEASEDWYPKGYSISGTAGYYNRCDVGITIHRTRDDFTRVIVWKARHNHISTLGEATLSYDPSTGRFKESSSRAPRPESEILDDF